MKQPGRSPLMEDVTPYPDRVTAEMPTNGDEPSVLDLLLRLAEWKFFIFKFVAACVAIAVVVAFVWPKSYTATTKIMPPQQSQSSLASAMMGQLGQLSPLAAMAGNNLGLRSVSDIYIYMLRSRTVADDLIDRFSLMSVYKDKKLVDARDDLKDNTQISSGSEGGITISVLDHDPKRAAEIANGYVEELKKLSQTLAVSEAGRRRIFFESEVQRANDELSQAELAMKKTQEQTGIIQLDSQSKAMIEALTALHAQVAAKGAQVQAVRSFATPENPDLIRLESELAAMRSELARMEAGQGGTSLADVNMRKVPEKALEYVRRLRDLKYREAVLEALFKQYELARIDEAKDAAIIQVLDKAVPPEVRSWPKRSLIVLTAALLALFFAVVIVLVSERLKADPLLSARLQLLRSRLLAGSGR
jgi:tyrosine-protein kinase Etk/Wzc